MNKQTKDYITTELLTIGEVAQILHVSIPTAMKRSERGGWDHVLKGSQKLYAREDIVSLLPADHSRYR